MSSFETIQDAAFALKAEGQEIKINFKKGVPATGRATVEWTIPKPAQGCDSTDTGAYAGIVILLNTVAMDASNIPQDGTVYVGDPSADFDLSTADRVGNAMVVGAFYECEVKSRGEELTTSVVINDIAANESYYVAGYALDCQNRYHSDGIRAYSDVFSAKESGSIPASQTVNLGVNGSGVLPTDGTGLIPGVDYQFDLIYDNTFPEGSDFKTIEITIDGINAGTYQELLDEIRSDILLIDNPIQSPTAPNAGGFYWNVVQEQLYQFDGYDYTEIESINEPTDPSIVAAGTYWFDAPNNTLNRWNIPNPTGWNVVPFVVSEDDPTNLGCDSYWYDGTIARTWNSSAWCDGITINSELDPYECPVVPCGTHWFDENLDELKVWNESASQWDTTAAIMWSEQPNNLSNGTYWFNDATSALSIRSANAWVDITVTSKIQETEPSVKIDGMLWYTPSTEELKQYMAALADWIVLPVLVWAEDPTVVTSCDLWWNSVNDNLYTWDGVHSEWDVVANFVQGTQDPSQPEPLTVGTFWYNTSTTILSLWDGGAWVVVNYLNKATDPTIITLGETWFAASTNTWKVWDTPNAGWNVINPTDSDIDPNSIPNGTYWFDSTNTALQVRNGVTWTNVVFTTQPFAYTRGDQWYDTSLKSLHEWNGTTWATALPVVIVSFSSTGGFDFITRERGSHTAVLIPTPEGSVASHTPCSIGTGFSFEGVTDTVAASCEYGTSGSVGRVYPARGIPENSFLWSQLNPHAFVITPKGGNDGKSGVPSYLELGVGTDGTPDERRELMDSIRRQLGYPVVDVELDNVQLDTCVNISLETYRQRAAAGYRRGFFFLDIEPGKQQYLMTNKVIGYNRIVTVMSAYRFTSAFLSSAHGAGAYGQIVLQHLYNMGTYDLTSFFLVSQYVEQLEHLFATRLTYSFHEHNRMLSFYSAFTRSERVLLDCMVERSEQDLLKDRYSKIWIERYALAEAMMMLSQIRGKFSSLPGAGGGISLNAAELVTLAQSYRDDLIMQLDEYVADTPEDVGLHSSFILG